MMKKNTSGNIFVYENIIEADDFKYLNDYIDNGIRQGTFIDLYGDGRLIQREPKDFVIESIVIKYVDIILNKYKEEKLLTKLPMVSDFMLAVSPPNTFVQPHNDNTEEYGQQEVTILMYLNDDFDGGELGFPDFNYEYKPQSGAIVSFDGSYTHEVKNIKSGNRRAVAIGTTLDKEKFYKFGNE